MAGVLWLQRKGVEVINIDLFDGKQFVKEKGQYLLSYFGKEVGLEQIKHSNLDQELKYAKEFLKKIKTENRIPTMKDITKLLKLGYLMICNLNWYSLNQKEGYIGHFVIVTGYDNNDLILQDPGLPAHENRKVPYQLFEKAWAYPDEKAKNILAFRLPK